MGSIRVLANVLKGYIFKKHQVMLTLLNESFRLKWKKF